MDPNNNPNQTNQEITQQAEQPFKLPVLQGKSFPEVPEFQSCHSCGANFKVSDLVSAGYRAQCCQNPTFLVKYAKKEVFIQQEQDQISQDVQHGRNLLAMRYEDRGYDSSVESGKGKNAYKVYYNPDNLAQSKQRLLVAAFLKQFQEHVDNQDLISLFVGRNFDVESVLNQVEMSLKQPIRKEES